MDPMAEPLSQLSEVTHSIETQLISSGLCTSQLQKLQVQLELQQQQLETARNTSWCANDVTTTITITQSKATANTLTQRAVSKLSRAPHLFQHGRTILKCLKPSARPCGVSKETAACLSARSFCPPQRGKSAPSRVRVNRGDCGFWCYRLCSYFKLLDVALENLCLKEGNKEKEPPPLPL